jgi:peptide chain release factor 1
MIIEVRPGEGGDDAVAFAQELMNALHRFAARSGGTAVPLPSTNRTLRARIDDGVASQLTRFSGVHRVQRVPRNDARGRRHTSTATVALLPDMNSPVVTVDDADIRVDFFRGTGPGGQHRNKTSTAVRLTHIPTGIVITRTSGRSQQGNLNDARDELARRLSEQVQYRDQAATAASRRDQIIADSDAKAFTHNEQRDEVINHRTGQRWSTRQFATGRH